MELTWDIYPAFRGPGFTVRYYSVIYVVVFLVGYLLTVWQIRRGGGEERAALVVLAGTILSVFLGGRLLHVVIYDTADFLADPMLLLRFWEGGIASHGSMLGLAIWLALVGRIYATPVLDVIDRVSFGAAFGAAMVRIGNLFNSEVVGRPTDQSWGVRFPRYEGRLTDVPLRHPSQIYEFALGAAVLGLLLAVDRRMGESRPRGLLTFSALALYFTGRFVVEFFKAHQALPADAALTMGQWLSIPPALLGWTGVVWSLRRRRPAGWGDGRVPG